MKKFKLVETLRDEDGDVLQAVTFYDKTTREKLKKSVMNYVQRSRNRGIRYLYRITECKVMKPNTLIIFFKKTKI